MNNYNKLTTVTFISCQKNVSNLFFSISYKILLFTTINWEEKSSMTWGQIIKNIQIYGRHKLFCFNLIWCSFTPCVDSVMAAAAADFPGLPKWLAATDLYPSSSEMYFWNSKIWFKRKGLTYHRENFYQQTELWKKGLEST